MSDDLKQQKTYRYLNFNIITFLCWINKGNTFSCRYIKYFQFGKTENLSTKDLEYIKKKIMEGQSTVTDNDTKILIIPDLCQSWQNNDITRK